MIILKINIHKNNCQTANVKKIMKIIKLKPLRKQKNSVCITDKGKNLMPRVIEIADAVINEALNGIETENRELLRTMLDKIYDNLENKHSQI